MLMVFFFWSMIFMIYCLSLVIAVASTGYIIVTVVNIFTGLWNIILYYVILHFIIL